MTGASGAPLRVLHLIEDLGSGGAERLLYVNLSRLDRERFAGIVCHLYDRSLHWKQPLLDLGYQVLSLDLSSIRDLPRGVVRLSRLLAEHPVDLVHTHLYGANLAGRVAGAMKRVPVLSSLHNPDYEPALYADNPAVTPAKLQTLRLLDRLTCRMARPRFLAVSHYVKQSAVEHLGVPPESVDVIYNPVDLAYFTPNAGTTARAAELRAELDLAAGAPVIVCVARMDPQKGLRYLVDALPMLIRQFQGLTVVVVGAGTPAARAALEARADALGVRSHLRFTGVQADVRPYLELCDLFVLPSLYEGLGIAFVEAMAMERACVGTQATAVPGVVADGRSGLLVPPADAPALAEAIARLLRDPELRAGMGREGRRLAFERFDAGRNVAQLESLYESVVQRTAVRRPTGRAVA